MITVDGRLTIENWWKKTAGFEEIRTTGWDRTAKCGKLDQFKTVPTTDGTGVEQKLAEMSMLLLNDEDGEQTTSPELAVVRVWSLRQQLRQYMEICPSQRLSNFNRNGAKNKTWIK